MSRNTPRRISFSLIFVTFLPIFVAALSYFYGLTKVQFGVVVMAALLYLILAMLHHYRDKTLTFDTMVEYVIVAIVIFIVLVGNIN